MRCKIVLTADLPVDLLQSFMQYVRTFDAEHADCRFKIEGTVDLTTTEINVMIDEIKPPLPLRKTIRKH
jgi:hypothetical protein